MKRVPNRVLDPLILTVYTDQSRSWSRSRSRSYNFVWVHFCHLFRWVMIFLTSIHLLKITMNTVLLLWILLFQSGNLFWGEIQPLFSKMECHRHHSGICTQIFHPPLCLVSRWFLAAPRSQICKIVCHQIFVLFKPSLAAFPKFLGQSNAVKSLSLWCTTRWIFFTSSVMYLNRLTALYWYNS